MSNRPIASTITKKKNKRRLAQKKWCRQKSVKAGQEEEVELRGIGFKPAVKERELWISRV